MADVTIRHQTTREERRVPEAALPGFLPHGWQVVKEPTKPERPSGQGSEKKES